MAGRSPEDAERVLAARAGDELAFTALFQRWFDPCYDVAWRIVRDDGRAAEIAQDTFLVAWQQLDSLRDPAAFGGWVLRTARNRALNRLEHERRAAPTDDGATVFTARAAPDDPAAAMTRAEQEALLRAASLVLGERDASVLDLHLRHDLEPGEIVEELGITPNAAHQTLHRLRGRLAIGIRAWVLWHDGAPRCDVLAGLLRDAGLVAFGRDVVRVVEAHAPDCEECSDRLAAVLAPEAMFAAVPLLAAAPDVRRRVAEALRAEGVPIDPDGATTATSSPTADGSLADGSTADARTGGVAPRRPVGAWLLGAAATIVVGGLLALSCVPDDDEPPVAGPLASTTSTTSASTSSADTSLTTTAAAPSTTAGGATTASVVPAPAAPPTTQGALLPPQPSSIIPPPASTPPVSPPPAWPPPTWPPPTTAAAAPTVDSFTATPAVAPGGACPGGQWATTLTWTTTGATSVQVAAADITTITGLPADGSTVSCRMTPSPPVGGWTLTATGPGGTDTATA